jgi:pimeloyl-ACP methyl ester carboxylesterase
MNKKIRILISILVGSYVVFGVVLYFYQSHFIYFPSQKDFNDCPGFADSQKISWQGTRMYVKNTSDKWVVFFHGNAGSACDRTFMKSQFEKFNYSYIFVEYAGYSNDPRKPSEKLLTQDAKNAVEYLATQHPATTAIIGESLGTAMATYAATILNPDKLILISPFNNLPSAASLSLPMYPVNVMIKDTYPTDQWINNLQNVIIIHGDQDTTIPIALGRKLFNNIASDKKEFIEIPDAGHNDIYSFPGTIDAIHNALQ